MYCTGKIRTNQKNLFYLLNCKYDNMYCRITFCKLFTLKHIQYSIHYCCKMLPLFVFENIFKLAPVGAFTFLHLYCFFFLQNISGRQSKVLHHEYSERHKMQAINSARWRVPAQYISLKSSIGIASPFRTLLTFSAFRCYLESRYILKIG